ncbi:hypothetical protein PHLCEN_2v10887 [Hermanssonia centrifuga]|uniref:Uncharacterized protein n=1 Tax=Hermanssonia centrifuga TaxID=98765 RepID=A0A2R6NLK2_9APHY|nr:hypothetical protein PHLCEN_2v10887 [Hermanssonia centrifuga]
MANPSLASAYNTWRWQAVANAQRARSDEAMRMMYSAAGIGPSSPMFTIGSHANPQGQLGGCQVPNFENTSPGSKRYTGSAASSPTPSYDGYGRQYGNGGNNPDAGGDSHATWLDTTNAVLNLANTVMGGSGNGDGSPGGAGSGNSASGGFNFNDDGGFGSQEFDGGWNSGGFGSPFGTQTFNSAGGFGDGGFSDQQFGTGGFGGAGMMYTHGPSFGGGEVGRGYNGGFGDAGSGFIF